MGVYIELDENIRVDDRLEAAFSLKCKCGHEVRQHAFSLSVYPTLFEAGRLYVSQCCWCGYTKDNFKCECFELEEIK